MPPPARYIQLRNKWGNAWISLPSNLKSGSVVFQTAAGVINHPWMTNARTMKIRIISLNQSKYANLYYLGNKDQLYIISLESVWTPAFPITSSLCNIWYMNIRKQGYLPHRTALYTILWYNRTYHFNLLICVKGTTLSKRSSNDIS